MKSIEWKVLNQLKTLRANVTEHSYLILPDSTENNQYNALKKTHRKYHCTWNLNNVCNLKETHNRNISIYIEKNMQNYNSNTHYGLFTTVLLRGC